jgi:hypothetical protein
VSIRQAPVSSVRAAAPRQQPAPGGPSTAARPVLLWTALLALLVTASSLAGLLAPWVYAQETQNWTLQAQGQDVGNLLAVVVLLLAAPSYARGSLRGGLVWLGTLLYLVYAFVIYAMAVHFTHLFLVYVAVLALSTWGVLLHVPRLRGLFGSNGHHQGRAAAWVLIVIGVLFALLWLAELVPATVTGRPPASLAEAGLWVNPVHVIDLAVVLPAFILSGVAALRGHSAGIFWLGPWLVFSVLMGSSIVAAMALMIVAGEGGALLPVIMVSGVVLASLLAAGAHVREVGR